MKKIFTLCALGVVTLFTNQVQAQFSQNFDGGIGSLTGNCWNLPQLEITGNPAEVINGTGSLLSQPPVNNTLTRDLYTPLLDMKAGSFSLSFNYKITNNLNGNAIRTIEIGVLDVSGNFTSLTTVTLDNSTPVTVLNYYNTFSVTSGLYKIVLKVGGTTGGLARVVIDDLWTDVDPNYGPGTNCNSAPIAVDDTFIGISGTVFNGTVITNDSEPNGETMTAAIVAQSNDGTVVMNPDGSFSFTPKPNFTGTSTTFTYSLVDNGYDPLTSNVATVTINFIQGSPLPVHLVSFQGSMNKYFKVSLQWRVADNEIADRFEVQRSLNGTEFSTVGVVFATEQAGIADYNFSETVNTTAKVMYRLLMIDKNQEADYSRILVFQNKTTVSDGQIDIINNPVSDKLTFSYNSLSSQPVSVKIYDMSGRLHLNKNIQSYEGFNTISINLPTATGAGMYVVEVTDGTIRQTAKFIKQ